MNSVKGKELDYDGYHGAQCVDLFNYYLRDVYGINPYPYWQVDRAYQIFDRNAPAGWTKISGNNNYRVGDIVVMNPYVGNGTWVGSTGHVAIVYSVNPVKLLEQNYKGRHDAHVNPFDGRQAAVRGVFRPTFNNPPKEVHPAAANYIIQTAVGSRFLDVSYQSKTHGANIQIYDPYDSKGQVFHINRNSMNTGYAVQNLNSGLFMDTDGNAARSGPNVIQWDGNGVNGQQWRFWDAGGGYVYISNLYGYFLDVVNGVNANGTNVRVWDYNGSNAQKFKLIKVSGNITRPEKGSYIALYAAGNRFLDVKGASKDNGANIQIYKPNGSAAQIFSVARNGANSGYYFQNPNSGKFLDTKGNKTGQQNVIQYQGNGAFGQQWVIEDAGGGLVYIRNLYGYYLDVTGNKNEDGVNVQVYPFNGSNAQKWKLIRVSGKVKSTNLVTSGNDYVITSKIGDKVLTRSGTNLVISQRSSNANTQEFTIKTLWDGYSIIDRVSGKYADSSVAKNTGNALEAGWTGNKTQNWFIEDAGGGYVYIRNLWGYYLDVANGVNANGTNVNVWKFNGNDNQKWKLQAATRTYTVRFNANGGQGSMPAQSVTADSTGSKFPSVNAFTREGYSFAGWKVQKIHGETTYWIVPNGTGWTWKHGAGIDERKLYSNTQRFLFGYNHIEHGDTIVLWASWTKKADPPQVDPTSPADPAITDPGQPLTEQEAQRQITSRASDTDLPGSRYGLLQLKAAKVTKKTVKVTWKQVPGASRYIVYGNACGKQNHMKKLKATSGRSYTLSKLNKRKLGKGRYYKFLVLAVSSKGEVISTSKVVHAATTGGKPGNDKAVKTKAKKGKVTLKQGKTFRLKAKAVPKSKKHKVRRHRTVSFESSDPSIATVTSKGVIKAGKAGKCYVYAYAQNGVAARISVTVR
ncbi:MAG: RICIN domain-containing protein [Firmicutes bacterium]|nr:RICIN domain-containing protein [Bacillota bacterium]